MALELEIRVDDKGTATVKRFKDSATRDIKKAETQTDQSSRKMESRFQALKTRAMAAKVAFAAVGVAAVAMGRKIFGAIEETASYRDEITKLSKATGISTDALVGFRHAAELGGTEVGAVERGLRTLFRRVQDVKDGLLEGKRAFEQIGVSVMEADGSLRAGEEIFLDVAEAMKNMTNDTERAALAQEIFGRSGLEMVPMLMQGKDALLEMRGQAEDLGLTFDAVSGRQAEAFNDQMNIMKKAIKGTTMQLIGESGLIQALTNLALILATSLVWVNQFREELLKMPGMFRELNISIKLFNLLVALIGKESEEASAGAKTFGQIMNELRAQFDEIKNAGSPFADMPDDIDDTVDSLADMVSMSAQAGVSMNALNQAVMDFNSLTLQGKEILPGYVDAIDQNVKVVDTMIGANTAFEDSLASALGGFSDMVMSFKSEGKELGAAFKAFAIVETFISTYAAAQKAYHSQFLPVPTPSSPVRGTVAAAAAVASGIARVAAIRKQKYARGGSFIVPPGYPNDSYPILVQSGERVDVTPANQVSNSYTRNANIKLVLPNVTNITPQTVRYQIIPMMQRIMETE